MSLTDIKGLKYQFFCRPYPKGKNFFEKSHEDDDMENTKRAPFGKLKCLIALFSLFIILS